MYDVLLLTLEITIDFCLFGVFDMGDPFPSVEKGLRVLFCFFSLSEFEGAAREKIYCFLEMRGNYCGLME